MAPALNLRFFFLKTVGKKLLIKFSSFCSLTSPLSLSGDYGSLLLPITLVTTTAKKEKQYWRLFAIHEANISKTDPVTLL